MKQERPDKWNKTTAINIIAKNGGKIKGNVIYFPNAGIKIQGAIDYLVNYCKFKRG